VEKDVDNFQGKAKRAGVLLPQMPFTFSTPGSMKEIHPPGTPIELNLKLLATPNISNWDYQVLESDASQQLQKLGGQPKEMFYNLPVSRGSPRVSVDTWVHPRAVDEVVLLPITFCADPSVFMRQSL